LGYHPYPLQVSAHRSQARVVLVAGAERSGKSLWVGREILARLPWCRRVAIAAQEYDECRPEMQYVINGLQLLGGLERRSTPQHGKWSVTVRGGVEIETISLHDGPDELTGRGQAFDVVALVEAGRIRYDAFLAARGRVAEVRGTVIAAGTLWDTFGWYADLYKAFAGPNVFEGQRFSFPAWHNLEIYPGGREDPEILRLKRIYPDDEFARLVAAELRPSPARIYPEFEYAVHVAQVAFDREAGVELAVDAGYFPSHYAVLALQMATDADGRAVLRQIDEVYEQHKTHHDVVEMCKQRDWWEKVAKVWGGHETRQHQAAASTQETWQELTHLPFEIVDAGRIVDGIVRVKTFLRDPASNVTRYVVDVGCLGTQREFEAYKRKTDSKGNVTSDEPEDANNDALDALRNLIVGKYGVVEHVKREPTPGKRRQPARG